MKMIQDILINMLGKDGTLFFFEGDLFYRGPGLTSPIAIHYMLTKPEGQALVSALKKDVTTILDIMKPEIKTFHPTTKPRRYPESKFISPQTTKVAPILSLHHVDRVFSKKGKVYVTMDYLGRKVEPVYLMQVLNHTMAPASLFEFFTLVLDKLKS
jgi:hypothetical protein